MKLNNKPASLLLWLSLLWFNLESALANPSLCHVRKEVSDKVHSMWKPKSLSEPDILRVFSDYHKEINWYLSSLKEENLCKENAIRITKAIIEFDYKFNLYASNLVLYTNSMEPYHKRFDIKKTIHEAKKLILSNPDIPVDIAKCILDNLDKGSSFANDDNHLVEVLIYETVKNPSTSAWVLALLFNRDDQFLENKIEILKRKNIWEINENTIFNFVYSLRSIVTKEQERSSQNNNEYNYHISSELMEGVALSRWHSSYPWVYPYKKVPDYKDNHYYDLVAILFNSSMPESVIIANHELLNAQDQIKLLDNPNTWERYLISLLNNWPRYYWKEILSHPKTNKKILVHATKNRDEQTRDYARSKLSSLKEYEDSLKNWFELVRDKIMDILKEILG